MSNPWFRHYCGMMRDEKLVGAAVRSKQPVERVVWVWGAILESASEIDDGGKFEFDCSEAAYFLRTDEADISAIIAALELCGRLDSGVVVKWSDRQFQSDKSNQRQAAYRERKRAKGSDSDDTKTACDVTVTSRDGVVTPQDTDTDTDTDTEKKEAQARVIDRFDEFYEAFPNHVAKGGARKAWKSAIIKTSPDTIIAAARVFASKQVGKDKTFIPHPATWLNAERWADENLVSQAPSLASSQVFVPENTEAFKAWELARGRKLPAIESRANGNKRGYFFPTEFPPQQQEVAA